MLMETFARREALKAGEREVVVVHSRQLDHTNTEYRQRIKALRKRLVVDKIKNMFTKYFVFH